MMGTAYKRIGFIEVCEALKNSPHYKSKLKAKIAGAASASASGSTLACNPRP